MLRAVVDYLSVNIKKTPLFMWVYLAVIIYMFKRVSRDFMGVGTKKKKILGKTNVALTREEESIAECVVDPAALKDDFDSVGGLEETKQALIESIIWPFKHPEMFPEGSLQSHPTGVLLHGAPGTGKTLLARALAKELNGHFIEVRTEKLFSRYVGDSEKLSAAVFSLARKLQPAVIFIDELDTLLSTRTDMDTTVYMHTKTIFLTLWDGLSAGKEKIIVVGATNRPRSLDEAVMRRLPIRLAVAPPSLEARRSILKIMLKDQLAENGDPDELDVDAIARWTEGFTGSDLRELCKSAGIISMRERMRAHAAGEATQAVSLLKTPHFVEALKRQKKAC